MKIERVETVSLEVPFDVGGKGRDFLGHGWNRLSIVLVKVETSSGITGYGEAFSYHCRSAVEACLRDMVAPLAIGRDARDIVGTMRELQQALHLFGRYGITQFALSGLDIALWDIAAKEAGLPLYRLLGGKSQSISAYASLFRYGDAEDVAEQCGTAIERGYEYIKIHEVTATEVAAAREAIGDDVPLMVDTNCPWNLQEAQDMAQQFAAYDLYWLEEPIFPPEDFKALARLQETTGQRIAAGENACTSYEFQKMFDANAVSFAQPSVTKVGGITELMKVAALGETHGVNVVPHSPYFGPGFLATLHAAAAMPKTPLIERFYMELGGSLYGDLIDPVNGQFKLPEGPGLGCEPDADVMREFAV